eukprot:GHVU01116914.1.p1 GENE.GHVU01116914.1~~GHVU01116914.1.p1  ORF type:complete len:802 (+),score=74.06 GHVU01116914.1:212-2617(+)
MPYYFPSCRRRASEPTASTLPRKTRPAKRYAPWKPVIPGKTYCPSMQHAIPTSLPPERLRYTVSGKLKQKISVAPKPTLEMKILFVKGLREFLRSFNEFAVCMKQQVGPVLHSIRNPDWDINTGNNPTYVGLMYRKTQWFIELTQENGFERIEVGEKKIQVVRDALYGEVDRAFKTFVDQMVLNYMQDAQSKAGSAGQKTVKTLDTYNPGRNQFSVLPYELRFEYITYIKTSMFHEDDVGKHSLRDWTKYMIARGTNMSATAILTLLTMADERIGEADTKLNDIAEIDWTLSKVDDLNGLSALCKEAAVILKTVIKETHVVPEADVDVQKHVRVLAAWASSWMNPRGRTAVLSTIKGINERDMRIELVKLGFVHDCGLDNIVTFTRKHLQHLRERGGRRRDMDQKDRPRNKQDGRGDLGGQPPAPICRQSDTEGCRYLPEAQKAAKRVHNKCDECYKWNESVIDHVRRVKWQAEYRGVEWMFEDVAQAARILLLPCIYCNKEPSKDKWGSIERFNNNSQYAPGTVVPSCWPCNYSKGILDAIEFFMAHQAIKHFRTQHEYGGDDSRPVSDLTPGVLHHNMKQGDYKVDFDISHVKKLQEGPCFYCGREPAMSIDRFDNDEGYTVKNSVSACNCCNFIKKQLTHEELNIMNDKVTAVFTRSIADAIPIRSPPRRKEDININVKRDVNHILTDDEATNFVFPDAVNAIDTPTFVKAAKSLDNVIDGCGDIKNFELPLHMSYLKPEPGVHGHMFQIVKVYGVKGDSTSSLLGFSNTARCVPTIAKVLQSICLYKQSFRVKFTKE